MRIYVGNLSYSVTQAALEGLFAEHGNVEDVHLPSDRDTGRPRGFAFVEMPDAGEARAAIAALDGTELEGRSLKVNEARPRKEGGRGGRGGRW
ncbi:MAG: RNA-binding protein [Phycisphaerae bacterium]